MRKKGQIEIMSIIIIPLLILFMAIIVIISYSTVGAKFSDMRNTMKDPNFNQSSQYIISQGNSVGNFWDFICVLLIFGVWLIEVIASFILGNSPLFYLIYFLTSFMLIFTGVIVKIVMKRIIESQALASFVASIPMTSWVINNFVIISIIWVVSIGVILYAKHN